jgi:hypothetical protein
VRWVRAFVAGVLIAVVGVTPASAGSRSSPAPCWKQLLSESWGGAITTIYPLRCYVQAIDHLQGDLAVSGGLKRDILAAEVAAEHGKHAPPETPLPQPGGGRPLREPRTARPLGSNLSPLLGPNLMPCFVTKPGRSCIQAPLPNRLGGGRNFPLWLWPALAGCLLVAMAGIGYRRRSPRFRAAR